nr:hypothetical protein Iba_chr11bCG10820 [Ipomoea batatas]
MTIPSKPTSLLGAMRAGLCGPGSFGKRGPVGPAPVNAEPIDGNIRGGEDDVDGVFPLALSGEVNDLFLGQRFSERVALVEDLPVQAETEGWGLGAAEREDTKSEIIALWAGLNLPYQMRLTEILPASNGPLWYWRSWPGSSFTKDASFLEAKQTLKNEITSSDIITNFEAILGFG